MIAELNSQFFQSPNLKSKEFVVNYISKESEIVNAINEFDGLKCELYVHDLTPRELRFIKYGSIFSDLISIYLTGSSKGQFHMHLFNPTNPLMKKKH